MKNTYLYRLYRHSQMMFWGVSIFATLTVFLTLLGHQITPFFLWAMFSEKETIVREQEVIEIKIDGEPLNYTEALMDANRHIVTGSIGYYYKMKINGDIDPTRTFFSAKIGTQYTDIESIMSKITNDSTQYVSYQNWLLEYLERSLNRPIHTLEVGIQKWRYDTEGHLALVTNNGLFKVEK